jgi:hypothetical protein
MNDDNPGATPPGGPLILISESAVAANAPGDFQC